MWAALQLNLGVRRHIKSYLPTSLCMLIPALTLLLSLGAFTLAGLAAVAWLRPPRSWFRVLAVFVAAAQVGLVVYGAAYSWLLAPPGGRLTTRAQVDGYLGGLALSGVVMGTLAAWRFTARLRRAAASRP